MTIETFSPTTAALSANDITTPEWEELVGQDGALSETFRAGSAGELRFLLIATKMSLTEQPRYLQEALRSIQVEGFGGGTVRVIVDVLGALQLAGAPVSLADFQAPDEFVHVEGQAATIADSAIARRARYALEALLRQRSAILTSAAPMLLDRVHALRDEAVQTGDVAAAIRIDNLLEDFGMSEDARRTCFTCQKIVSAEHEHTLTGAVLVD